MDFLIDIIRAVYFQILPRTLMVFGIVGLSLVLYTHQFKYLLYSLLAGLPLNVVVILVFITFFRSR